MGKGLPLQNQGETRGRQRNGGNPKSRYHARSKDRDRTAALGMYPDNLTPGFPRPGVLEHSGTVLTAHGGFQADATWEGPN